MHNALEIFQQYKPRMHSKVKADLYQPIKSGTRQTEIRLYVNTR
jgi:hypothetical protein